MEFKLTFKDVRLLRWAFYAVRGQNTTPNQSLAFSRFEIDDGRVWRRITKNLTHLDRLDKEFTETLREMQKSLPQPLPDFKKEENVCYTPESLELAKIEHDKARTDSILRFNAKFEEAAQPILNEEENLACLSPISEEDFALAKNGQAYGCFPQDMAEVFDKFLDASKTNDAPK